MSEQLRKRARVSLLYMIILLQSAAFIAPLPARVFAQESTPTESVTQPSTPPVTPVPTEPPKEVRRPTGSAAHTFIYNFKTGLWENEYYTWDPVTSVRTAKFAPEHTYNEQVEVWEVREWVYVASEGVYRYRVVSTYAPAPPPVTTPAPTPTPDTPSTNTPTSPGAQEPTPSVAVVSPATIPTQDISVIPTQQTNVDLTVDAALTHTMNSTAVTGNAAVLQNTTAGNATSGDAYAMANILNMVQSAWGIQGLQPNVYSADIQGNYYGDIVINSSQLTAQTNPCGCGDMEVNATINGSITNDVNLLAQSGDATVQSNTSAGDATTGNATAIANIMNLINSSITSGQSFVGVLNVHGDLEGDVLMPEEALNQLLVSNVPRSQMPIGSDSLINLEDTQSITNSVTTTATSGAANVNNNTTAGSATSGNAQTNVTIFNLTGRQIIGANALLVFVNVAGEWVGFITNAPDGATAAVLGDTTSQSSCLVCTVGETTVETNAAITNNVNIAARTGAATVQHNTNAGDATSGDARAAANIANVTNSSFSLSNWFGILFINVFGNWHGSFGTDTAYGGMIGGDGYGQTPATGTQVMPLIGNTQTPPTAAPPAMKVFSARFAPDDAGNEVLVAATEQIPPPPSEDVGATLSQTASLLSEDATRDFSTLLLVLAGAAAFVVIMHGDSLKALALRTRQL